MTQYIDKDVLVAELERLKEDYGNCQTHSGYEEGLKEGRRLGYIDAISFINSLELKEVNLETELKQWWNNHYSKSYPFDAYAGHYIENSTVIEIVKYFFELGLKAQKGEDV